MTIAIELRSDHSLAITSSGTRSKTERICLAAERPLHDRRADDPGVTDVDTPCDERSASIKWRTRWTGRWAAPSSTTMSLDLRLASDTCKRTEQPASAATVSELNTAGDAVPCIRSSSRTRVTCTRALAPIYGPDYRSGEQGVWRCSGNGLGLSPSNWVFGTAGCIVVFGGHDHRPERIEDCSRRR
ncbi:MAG: hypothetical protein AB7P03_03245 [Kofleriaceae bacterium]